MRDVAAPKDISVTGQVVADGSNGALQGLTLAAGGVAASLIAYDGTDNTGTVLARLSAPANGFASFAPNFMVMFKTGVYVVLSGADAKGVAYV